MCFERGSGLNVRSTGENSGSRNRGFFSSLIGGFAPQREAPRTRPVQALMVGPRGAGKTAFLYCSKLPPKYKKDVLENATMTLHFHVEEIESDGYAAAIWDVAGSRQLYRDLRNEILGTIKFDKVIVMYRLADENLDDSYLKDLMNDPRTAACSFHIFFNTYGMDYSAMNTTVEEMVEEKIRRLSFFDLAERLGITAISWDTLEPQDGLKSKVWNDIFDRPKDRKKIKPSV